MTSRFQNIRIAPLSFATFLLALLVCPLTGGWAQTMEMQGDIYSDKSVFSTKNKLSSGNAYALLGTANGTMMVPALGGRSDSSSWGLYLYAFPDSTDTTVNNNAFSIGGVLISPRKNPGSELTNGTLFTVANYSSCRMRVRHDGQIWVGRTDPPAGYNTFTSAPIYVAGGTFDGVTVASSYLGADGMWHVQSTRASKTNIKDLPVQDAWARLDTLTPVEFEYRKSKTLVHMKDGTEALYTDAMAEAEKMAHSCVKEGEEMPPTAAQDAFREITSGEPYNVWTDEPSGLKTQGFIAEDLPDNIAAADHKSYAPALVTVANTAALKEAKRRITELEAKVQKLESGTIKTGVTGSNSASASAAALTQAEVAAVADRALVELGLLVEVEVAADDAWVQVDETTAESRVEAVTRYRLNAETRSVESYTAQETVSVPVPTGRKVWQLKDGVRLDEKTGKFLRVMLAPTAPASESEGLAKLLSPALRARFAAALRTQSAPAQARAVSMNLK